VIKQRLSVEEAARLWNVNEAAIRHLIQRGGIAHDKDEEFGRVFVVLHKECARLEVEAQRAANREVRHLLAAVTTRKPAIEPPDERDGDLTATERAGNGAAPTGEGQGRRSWWRRMFGTR
jgi:hypothetical protein